MATQPVPPAPRRRDWAGLPPLPGAAAAPLTAPSLEFVAHLATSQTLVHRAGHSGVVLAPPSGLLHVRSVDRPAGRPDGAMAPGAGPPGAGPPGAGPPEGPASILTPLPPMRRARSLDIEVPGRDASTGSFPDAGPAVEDPAPAAPAARGLTARVEPRSPVAEPSRVAERPVTTGAAPRPRPAGPTERRAVPEPAEMLFPPPPGRPLDPGPVPSPTVGATIRPIRPNLAQSRRMGLGPGYHGPLPEAIRLARAEREAPPEPAGPGPVQASTTPVPDEVRSELRTAYGVDVDVVHHGPEVSLEARRLGARAFTRGGEVFVPTETGPLDTPQGRATVAHELTHAVQQRRTGGVLPSEDSAAGQALEAEAQEAERWFRGDPGATRPGVAKPADDGPADGPNGVDEARAMMKRLVDDGFAVSDGGGGVVFTHLSRSGTTPGVQRQTAPAAPAAPRVSDSWGSFGHELFEDLVGFGKEIGVSSAGDKDQGATDKNTRETEFYKEQFKALRLEHRRTEERARRGTSELGSDDEARLLAEAEAEVKSRVDELEKRVNARLAEINRDRSGDSVVHTLDHEAYARVVHRLFDNPATAMPADDDADKAAAADAHPAPGAGGHPGATEGKHAGTGAGTGTGTGGGTGTGAGAGTGTGAGAGPRAGHDAASDARSIEAKAKEDRDKARAKQKEKEDKWETAADIRASLVGDVVSLAGGLFGLTLSDDELAEAQGRTHAAPAPDEAGAAAAGAAAGGPGGAAAGAGAAAGTGAAAAAAAAGAGAGAATGAAGPPAAKHTIAGHHGEVGLSGHEQLDLDHLDIDKLSVRLYERLRQQLRQELLIDRERAGLLTDFR